MRLWQCHFHIFAVILCIYLSKRITDADDLDDFAAEPDRKPPGITHDFDQRPRLIVVDGSLYFRAGTDRNITFAVGDAPGAGIFFGDVDVRKLPDKNTVERLHTVLNSQLQALQIFKRSLSTIQQVVPSLRAQVLSTKLRQALLFNTVKRLNDTRSQRASNRATRKLIAKLTAQMRKLYQLLELNECLPAPCQNGAECVDLFGGYHCICPNGFTGRNCAEREDECREHKGTPSGCQNNATCENNPKQAGFICHCAKGWHGPRCETQLAKCDQSAHLCGEHGRCVAPKAKPAESQFGYPTVPIDEYDCLCDVGFRKVGDEANPVCADINECLEAPCYPGAECKNLPGSFRCGQCPAGLMGNGIQCHDVDECASKLAYPCSRSPLVDCVNTFGSFKCGSCPSGYTGDGTYCEKIRFCDSNPCHPMAECVEEAQSCMCPQYHVGNGLKEDELDDESGCSLSYRECHDCFSGGTCRVIAGGKFQCFCPPDYYGSQCEHPSWCSNADSCSGRGRCQRQDAGFVCVCEQGYEGQRCEFVSSENCTMRIFDDEAQSVILQLPRPRCAVELYARDSREIIKLWFEGNGNATRDCKRIFMKIRETESNRVNIQRLVGFGNFCPEREPPTVDNPLFSATSSVEVAYWLLDEPEDEPIDTGYTLHFRAVDRGSTIPPNHILVCGGRYTQNEGVLDYRSDRVGDNCLWYISTGWGYHLELTVESFQGATGDEYNCTVNQLELFDDYFVGEEQRSAVLCGNERKVIKRLSGNHAVIRLQTAHQLLGNTTERLCRLPKEAESQLPLCSTYFHLSWKSIKIPECGGRIQLQRANGTEPNTEASGFIDSPNYGHAYFPNLVCNWLIDAKSAFNGTQIEDLQVVALEFVDFDVDSNSSTAVASTNSSTRCPGDFVRISTFGRERFCNDFPPPPIIYARHDVEILLFTDSSGRAGRGFRVKYRGICQQDITGQNGTITSPNVRVGSSMPFQCHYRILAEAQHAIHLKFAYIGLKPFSVACLRQKLAANESMDYIEFSGGHSSNTQINRRYYCARFPFVAPNGEVVASGGEAPLRFTYSTSGDPSNLGFVFTYDTENVGCGGVHSGESGTITSPNYPDRYPPHMYCIYDIVTSAVEKGLRLTFDVFNVENVASRNDCGFDFLRVYEFYDNEKSYGKLLGSFCGVRTPPPILTNSTRLSVVFMSDRSVSGAGFSARWESVDLKTDCDRVFTEPSGRIEFNSADYTRALQCDFQIVLPAMQRIEVTLNSTNITCNGARIQIRNGGTIDSPTFPGFADLCSGGHPYRLSSQGNQLFFRLELGGATGDVRFEVEYRQLASGCGGYINGWEGAISAPQYPLADSRMLQCEWQVAVAFGNKVQLSFRRIDDLDSADAAGICAPFARNFIDVLAADDDGTILKRYCRKESAPEPITSDSNQLVVRYTQNGGSVNGGLFGFYAQFSTVCKNIVLEAASGSIQSPGYPNQVNEARFCSWTIRTAPGSRIHIRFHKFFIPSSTSLEIVNRGRGGYIEVDLSQLNQTRGSNPTAAKRLFLGNSNLTQWTNEDGQPTELTTKSNVFGFSFQSNHPRGEFWLSWSTIGCGGDILRNNTEITAKIGDFVSADLSPMRECRWLAKAPPGFGVELELLELYTAATVEGVKGECGRKEGQEFNGLELFAGQFAANYSQHSYCGIVYNETYRSASNSMLFRLQFNSKKTTHQRGIVMRGRIRFVRPAPGDAQCGAIIALQPGHNRTISSPNYPKAYPRAVECIWMFSAPKGYEVVYNLSRYLTPNPHKRPSLPMGRFGAQSSPRCSQPLAFIEGGLTFFAGAYNRSASASPTAAITFAHRNVLQRVCLDSAQPLIVETLTNNSTLVFNGAPYEAALPSGDVAAASIVGFELTAFVRCGGTLWASDRRQNFVLSGGAIGENGCTMRVDREEGVDPSEPIYIRLESIFEGLNYWSSEPVDVNVKCDGIERLVPIGPRRRAGDDAPSNATNAASIVRTIKCNSAATLRISPVSKGKSLIINYDTESQFCGGAVLGAVGFINLGVLDSGKSMECEWTLTNGLGNTVMVVLNDSFIEESEFCAQSYVEIRKWNRTGPLMGRSCGRIGMTDYTAEALYVRLRRVVDGDEPEDGTQQPERFAFAFLKQLGGDQSLRHIEVPLKSKSLIHYRKGIEWSISVANATDYLMIRFAYRSAVEIRLVDRLCGAPEPDCAGIEPVYRIDDEVTPSGGDGSEEEYLIRSTHATIYVPEITDQSTFRLEWFPVPADTANSTAAISVADTDSDFTCGGDWTATYEPQTFTLPTANGKYAENLRCKWRVRRPVLGGVTFTIKALDMEEHPDCMYDYLVVAAKDYRKFKDFHETTHYTRYCRKDQIKQEIQINYDMNSYVYFISDRSRGFGGFTIEYRLTCRTFEYIEASRGIFQHVLESPAYPHTSQQNFSCVWGIMLETNRDVEITSLDMDLAPPNAAGECSTDQLRINDLPTAFSDQRRVHEHCGNQNFNFTARHGRVFFHFNSKISDVQRRGFRLMIREVIHECSSQNLHVDEHVRSAPLFSPEYPHPTPNSLDCRWVLSVPAGHRLKFTIDHNSFNLQSSTEGECVDDYLEIRDGPSERSPLVGKYCGTDPPSTVVSSDSFLFVRFSTDSYTQSQPWNATYEIASCGGTVVLSPTVNSTLTSPNYPDVYNTPEVCEWIVKPPRAHYVHATVKHLGTPISENCSADYLSIRSMNSTGEIVLPPTCYQKNLNPEGYFTDEAAYVRFQANSTGGRLSRMFCLNKKCGFDMELRAGAHLCGGTIDDEGGYRHFRSGPIAGRLMPGLHCKFDFRAGIGYRYRVEFFFLNGDDEDSHGYYDVVNAYGSDAQAKCFPDLEIWNGPRESGYSAFSTHQRFCVNSTSFVTSTDIATMVYEDKTELYSQVNGYHDVNQSRFYVPFGFRYTKVDQDYDESSCMFHIQEDAQIRVANLSTSLDSLSTQDHIRNQIRAAKSFCHIRIDNLAASTTIALKFTDFQAGRADVHSCAVSPNKVIIKDPGNAIFPVEQTLCSGLVNQSQPKVFVYADPQMDIFVVNNPYGFMPYADSTVQFNLSVTYHPCGGIITAGDENSNAGRIRSPGWHRGNYTNNADCLWILRAPEGMVVKLKFTSMDLQHQVVCENDYLLVSESEDNPEHSVIHRYCYDAQNPMPERVRTVRTHGRTLALRFHSDETISGKGFTAEWEFQHYENGSCGFTAHARTGIIHSPNYPEDYPNDIQCLWHIVVPVGHHVRLTYESIDIQKSLECTRDFITITQEHTARDFDPLMIYYFYYDHEELLQRSCGTEMPKVLESESNQIRVNFTTDSKVTGKGFQMRWEAVCGTVFRMNHGVVTSPHYPNFYPNEHMECKYLIDPDTDGVKITTLRVLDADLDDSILDGDRECTSDFLEVSDVDQNRVVMTVCGAEFNAQATTNLVSVKGAIGLRFVVNGSMLHEKKKNHRGFRLSYALSDCGGDVNLGETQNRLAGMVYSPGFPMPYHHDLDCIWNVTAPTGYVIAVKFSEMNLEPSRNCSFDYVEVFDGSELNDSLSFGRLCGDKPPEGHRMTSGNNVMIRFKTDHSSSRPGFFAVLTATLGPNRGCGGNIAATADWKTLQPPLGTDQKYFNNLRCLWKISTKEPNNVIEMKVTKFDVEERLRGNGSTECYDFMAIYDGPMSISPFLVRPTCSWPSATSPLPFHLYSSFRSAEIYFETDHSDQHEGFSIDYRATADDCGGIYTAVVESQEITYQSQKTLTRTHQLHKRCRFFIRGSQNEPIRIQFSQFNFPSKTNDCTDEYLQIQDVGTVAECQHPACASAQKEAVNSVRACHGTLPPVFVSRTSLVQIVTSVILQSQYSASYTLTYTLLDSCNRTITIPSSSSPESSGRITSPNFPNEYDHNATCITRIHSPPDTRILIVFREFMLERGNVRPRVVLTPAGSTVAPPRGTRPPMWRLSRPWAGPLRCNYDSLAIYFNETDPQTNKTFCGGIAPDTQFSPANTVNLHFHTDATMAYGGYAAYYYTATAQNDTTSNRTFLNFAPIRERDGILTNVGFPGYPANTTQRFAIHPPPGMDCRVSIYSSMAAGSRCASGESAKWVHYAGTEEPDKWINFECSMNNYQDEEIPAGERMLFEIQSDGDSKNNGLGLKVQWKCADSLATVFMSDSW